MKKIILTTLVACLFIFACNTELIDTSEDANTIASELSKKKKKKKKVDQPKIVKECEVLDADNCNNPRQPKSNFWWPETETDYYNGFFGTTDDHKLKLTEYENGSAHLTGTTNAVVGDCVVTIDVWFVGKSNWEEWSALGNDWKDEGGCSGDVKENLHYYKIDETRSTITSAGSDCLGEGVYGLTQRPEEKYGVQVGAGGAIWDSNIGAEGLGTWGWITDINTKERLWVMDFNFLLDCTQNEGGGCDTAFAKGNSNSDSTCFIEDTFNRWGWTIGPLAPGTDATYNVYAGAGQCDTSKGALAGTVNVVYDNSGNASVTYNIDNAYSVTETHTYIGSVKYPTKKNGKNTVAPGQYYIEKNLSGDIYVIAHAVVCRD